MSRTWKIVACCIAPFIVCCIIDPTLHDPGWVLLTGLPAAGGLQLLVAAWHMTRVTATVDSSVNRAVAGCLAGSAVERLLQDDMPAQNRNPARRSLESP